MLKYYLYGGMIKMGEGAENYSYLKNIKIRGEFMKKILSKVVLGIGLVSIGLLYGGINVSAQTVSWTTSNSFSSKWSRLQVWVIDPTDSNNNISCTYGYDTFVTNEDYVKSCNSVLQTHYATVTNSKGTSNSTGTGAPLTTTGKADVKHTGKAVTYSMSNQ